MDNIEDDTEYEEIEVRFGLQFFQELDDDIRDDIKELSEQYAYDQGFDHNFYYFWLKFTPHSWLMLNCHRPDLVRHFVRK
jgi:hypothetical protein